MKSATLTRHLRSCGCACLHVSYGLYSLIWEDLFSIWIGSFESRHFALYRYVFISVRQVFTEFRAQVHRDQDGRKRLLFAFIILQKRNVLLLLWVHTRGWMTSDFLKSTFMWWKSSRSRLVADDIINEQISLELWQTPCAQLWNMRQRCPHDYCTYNSLFLSVL